AKVPYAFERIDIPVDCGLAQSQDDAGLKRVDSVTCISMGAIPQASHGVRQFALITQAIRTSPARHQGAHDPRPLSNTRRRASRNAL
ncbi:hypothetical protein RA273_28345, partial [Pseudomonas syringae pv. tagetis]